MKTIRKVIFLLLTVFLISSCSDSFLDLHTKEATDARNAIVDIQSMEYAIYGLYALLQNSSYYNRTFYLLPDLMSDNVYLSNRRRFYAPFEKYMVKADNSYVEGTWNQIYRVIVNSNLIIQKGSNLKVLDSEKAKKRGMIGEAYAIRGLANFDLCRLYAQPYNFTADASQLSIPLVLKSSFNVDELTFPKRSTVKEVYDAIVQDFKQAIQRLPVTTPGESSSFKGRITLNAAKALLSRVYLYMGDWKDSEDMATEVIDSKQYTLLATDELVSDYSNRNNSESIFEIINSFTDNSGSNSVDYYYNQDGYGDALASWNLYNLYSSTDVRRNFMKIGDRSGGGGEKDVPLVTKFKKLKGNFAQDVIVIRLAEVYLNRAEARAHLGDDAGAIADLTAIAKRADPNVKIDPSLTGQRLINRILLERRKELAFEGQRLFDLTRNKKSFVKYHTGGDSTIITYPSKKTILPIPQRELNINKNITQNPGY
jgi:hypothetical protein